MKTRIIISLLPVVFFLSLPSTHSGQDSGTIFREAQRLEESRKEAEALKKYLEVVNIQPQHVVALCKVSELHCLLGSRQQQKQTRIEHYKTAKQYAETALMINPNHSDANFVMAMAMGRIALVVSGNEKIKAVNDIKKYAETAIRNDPSNYKAYHVLGKWHFEVSSLNAFERMGVKLFFGGFPPSSYAESIRCYERSRSISPGFALNYLELAKVYMKNNQGNKAIELLKKLQSIPARGSDDARIKREGNQLLASMQP